jgi:hypothetical protein
MKLREGIDLSLLPEEGKKELINFYKFLLKKYEITKKEESLKLKEISKFAGSLENLSIDPLEFQKSLREEWVSRHFSRFF